MTFAGKDFSPAIASLANSYREITLGARPHALKLGGDTLRGKVVSCQWLGDQTHVAVEIGGRLTVSVIHEKLAARVGSEIAFSIDSADLHMFDPADGKALAHGGAPA